MSTCFGSAANRLKAAELRPGTVFRDCADCPEMIVIPPGKFLMGSTTEDTQRDLAEVPPPQFGLATMLGITDRGTAQKFMAYEDSVTIPQEFALGKFLITRGEFAVFVRDTGYLTGSCLLWGLGRARNVPHSGWSSPGFEQTDGDPVVCITWNDAKAYIRWLNRKLRGGKLPANDDGPYRLPSEAEWEYAARAGTQTSRWWGNKMVSGYENCRGCNNTLYGMYTVPVGSFPANPFGLNDMLGNASQVMEDCWHETYDEAPVDGTAWVQRDCRRVQRGGSWNAIAWVSRSTTRGSVGVDISTNVQGFRLAKTLQN